MFLLVFILSFMFLLVHVLYIFSTKIHKYIEVNKYLHIKGYRRFDKY